MSYFSDISSPDPNELHFKLSQVDTSMANAVRRIILSEVPTVGFRSEPHQKSTIVVHKNTCNLHNEILAHRISMIPIFIADVGKFDPKAYRFVLKKKNQTDRPITVTSQDFEVYHISDQEETQLSSQEVQKLLPPDPLSKSYIVICKLRPDPNSEEEGEEVDIECTATISTGTENAHYSPVSKSIFYNAVDQEAAQQELQKRLQQLQSSKSEAVSKKEIENMTRAFDQFDKYRYFKVDAEMEPDEFMFEVESIGQMLPTEIVGKSLSLLISKLLDVKQHLMQPNSSKIKVTLANTVLRSYNVEIDQEDHTLGNLLQSYLYSMYIQHPKPKLTLVSYKCPHPLQKRMVLRVSNSQIEDQDSSELEESSEQRTQNQNQVIQILLEGVEQIITLCHQIRNEWYQKNKLGEAPSVSSETGQQALALGTTITLKRRKKKPVKETVSES